MAVRLSPNYILIILTLKIGSREEVLVTINIYILSYFNKDLVNL